MTETYNNTEIYNIMKQEDNKFCFDCGYIDPQWASVSNGVLICINCSGEHRRIGTSLSKVRSLTLDKWEPIQIEMLKLGGNKRLKDFLFQYNIKQGLPIEEKYNMSCMEYYRKVLYLEANDQSTKHLIQPDIVNGFLQMNNTKESNLNSYQSYGSNVEQPQQSSFFGKVGTFFEKTSNTIKSGIKDLKIDEKAKNLASKTVEVAKGAGASISEKSKEIYVSI